MRTFPLKLVVLLLVAVTVAGAAFAIIGRKSNEQESVPKQESAPEHTSAPEAASAKSQIEALGGIVWPYVEDSEVSAEGDPNRDSTPPQPSPESKTLANQFQVTFRAPMDEGRLVPGIDPERLRREIEEPLYDMLDYSVLPFSCAFGNEHLPLLDSIPGLRAVNFFGSAVTPYRAKLFGESHPQVQVFCSWNYEVYAQGRVTVRTSPCDFAFVDMPFTNGGRAGGAGDPCEPEKWSCAVGNDEHTVTVMFESKDERVQIQVREHVIELDCDGAWVKIDGKEFDLREAKKGFEIDGSRVTVVGPFDVEGIRQEW